LHIRWKDSIKMVPIRYYLAATIVESHRDKDGFAAYALTAHSLIGDTRRTQDSTRIKE